ncbi:uncharacterized protein LOC111270072 [Varroa jacobsoni]|uniref:Uncharacterized protein n=1 Tax=Varroa destructor TaxID=109461 RepID=A0A7M7JQD3_VARDE|nr:uncharacterized protein LOC111247958 [Varroa destructor]XP_022705811.1 uncharacterized protein LOC111270072 [Varroa jacobsoni]
MYTKVFSFSTCTLIALTLFTSEANTQSCHLRELDICAVSSVAFNKVATTEHEIDRYCNLFEDAKECFFNYTRKCMTPLHRELLNFGIEGAKELSSKFCKRGDRLRNDYLKHAPCIARAMPEGKKCLQDARTGFEKIEEAKFQDRISTACCTYMRYQNCLTGAVAGRCGEKAVQYGHILVRMASSNLIDIMCQGYDTNPVCKKLLPPPGTKPKGNSKSVVSKLFAAYVGI